MPVVRLLKKGLPPYCANITEDYYDNIEVGDEVWNAQLSLVREKKPNFAIYGGTKPNRVLGLYYRFCHNTGYMELEKFLEDTLYLYEGDLQGAIHALEEGRISWNDILQAEKKERAFYMQIKKDCQCPTS